MQDKKTTEILKQISSPLESDVLEGIKAIKQHGNKVLLEALIKVYRTSKQLAIQNAALNILNTLKNKRTITVLIEAAKLPENNSILAELIGAIWQSGLDPKGHLHFLVETALQNNYMVAFECFTVIESSEEIATRAEIEQELAIVGSYIEETSNSENLPIIKSTQEVLYGQLVN